jgi:hypothetical protein
MRLETIEPWGIFGFAVIDLNGPSAEVRYINESGVPYWPEPL